MKKIILKENQFNKIFLNEYLDRNYGIPLYRYLNMSYNQEIDALFKWGVDNDLIEEYYKNEDGMNYLLEYASDYVTEKYGEFDDEEEFENAQNSVLEELYSDLEYDIYGFLRTIKNNYNLCINLYNHLTDYARSDYYNAPAFVFFSQPRIIKNEWLVHFSDNAYHIAKEGFTYGTQELDRLAYSGAGDIESKFGEGYDFAYRADSATDVLVTPNKNWNTPKYGSEFVLFRASGVEAFHDGDQERQVIFYGPSAKEIIYIRKESAKGSEYYGDLELWQVCDVQRNRVIYETEDLEEVIDWAINNYSQYRKRIVSMNKNNNYEKNYR